MQEGVQDPPPGGGGSARKTPRTVEHSDGNDDFFKPYFKPGYTRVFPVNTAHGEYTVYVEKENEKYGNNNPLMLANFFKRNVKGVYNIKRINATKVGVVFTQAIEANNFLKDAEFLSRHSLRAFIPAKAVETVGVLRYVPTSISNEEIFKKLTCNVEVVAVRRFTKKTNGEVKPFTSVSVTFLSNTLPDYVLLDICRMKVSEYVPPLLQCYKCFKFNHGAKICKGTQICSICAQGHHYTKCTDSNDETKIKCVNCGGAHLAIARQCPVKQAKIEEKKNRSAYAAIVANGEKNLVRNYEKDFPIMKPKIAPKPIDKPIVQKQNCSSTQPKSQVETETKSDQKPIPIDKLLSELINNEFIMNGLVASLVALGNSNEKMTTKKIKEILIDKLDYNG
ncbi:hypothetical protein NE865_10120 [Phthorimaea operculella]|nr:hypothetical protein NE865_10120 [Phthorimaea operculella]